jgi:hypothetical protein
VLAGDQVERAAEWQHQGARVSLSQLNLWGDSLPGPAHSGHNSGTETIAPSPPTGSSEYRYGKNPKR